jgi:glucose/mannose-6-phosphate isomerase
VNNLSTSILDKLDEISKIDKSNMLSFCTEAPKHYRQAAKIAERLSWDCPKPKNIIISGMGGSAIGGELLKDWARNKAPFPIEVNREYQLPKYAGKKTLTLIVSYSGETEESLSTFLDAIKRKCPVCCISSGGNLLAFAEKLGVPYLRLPPNMPPRAALPYLFIPLLVLTKKISNVRTESENLYQAINILEKVSAENSPSKPAKDNFCKNLALEIDATVPVIYGSGFLRGVAQRFKQQFNENSKIPSKWEFFSELDHNEIVGWEKAGKLAKHFSTIFLRSKSEPSVIRCRIETTKNLVSHSLSKIFEVWSEGNTEIAQMLSTVCIGDFASVYLAILHKVDPTPVRTINLLKKKIGQNGTKEKVIHELKKITTT